MTDGERERLGVLESTADASDADITPNSSQSAENCRKTKSGETKGDTSQERRRGRFADNVTIGRRI